MILHEVHENSTHSEKTVLSKYTRLTNTQMTLEHCGIKGQTPAPAFVAKTPSVLLTPHYLTINSLLLMGSLTTDINNTFCICVILPFSYNIWLFLNFFSISRLCSSSASFFQIVANLQETLLFIEKYLHTSIHTQSESVLFKGQLYSSNDLQRLIFNTCLSWVITESLQISIM